MLPSLENNGSVLFSSKNYAVSQENSGCVPVTEIRRLILDLREAWRQRNWSDVLSIADNLLTKAPQNRDAIKMRLKAALKLNQIEKITEIAPDAASIEPQLTLTAVKALMKAHQPEGAARTLAALRIANAADLEGFSEASEKTAFLLFKAGEKESVSGNEDRARALWILGASIEPRNVLLRRKVSGLRASALEAAREADLEKDPQIYIAAWKNFLAINPTHVNALKRLATAFEKTGDHSMAMTWWGRLLITDPTNSAAPQRLARAALQCGQEYEALSILKNADKAQGAAGYLPHLQRKVASACKAALRASDGFIASFSIVLLMQTREDDDEIDILKRKCLALLNADIKRALKNRDTAKAAMLSNRLLEIEPQNPLALASLGRHAYLMHDFAAAAKLFIQFTHLPPEIVQYWRALSRAQARSGNAEGAAQAEEKAKTLESSNTEELEAVRSSAQKKTGSWLRRK